MKNILYYSTFCNNCDNLLSTIGRNETFKKDTHFICIDNRVKKSDGIYIILSNQKEILLPENITKVPALQLLNRGNQSLFGQDILKYIENNYNSNSKNSNNISSNINSEIESFNFGDFNNSGVYSDNFSFLDQSSESLSASGDGGLRQLRNNVTLEYVDHIETPIDDYTPNKVGEVSLDKIQQERNKALQ